MVCNGCGKGTRHLGTTHKHLDDEDDVNGTQKIKDYINSSKVDHQALHDELNNATFEELEQVRLDGDKATFEAFIGSFRAISDDFKASQVLNIVDIINGMRFSPEGLTPQYCVWLLHKILSFDDSGSINEKFPTLKAQIQEKYDNLKKNAIKL
jgi:hypothetical protein